MSYAEAAGKGSHQEQQKKYYNDKMVTCNSRGVDLDKLVDALHDDHILPHLSAIQKVKYGVMYALASDNLRVLENLVVNGLNVGDVHLTFKYHKIKVVNVSVSNIPYGISALDIQSAFSSYGAFKGARRIQRNFHGFHLYTGDWAVTFDELDKEIPSYVMVRGWLAYVKYDGQTQTCCQCSQSGHVFVNCPQRKQEETRPEETPRNENDKRTAEPEDMDTHEPPPNEPDLTEEEMNSTSTMQEENPGYQDVYQEILENLEPTAKEELAHVTVEDCQVPTFVESETQQSEENLKKQSQAWADSADEPCVSGTVGSKKPEEQSERKDQKTEVKTKVRPTIYCPNCRLDSHTEDQCGKVSYIKQTSKRKIGRRDSKPGKGETVGKKRRNIKGFKSDIESIVTRGSRCSDVQYIVESEGADELYALYLVSRFGSRGTALTASNLYITRNQNVMALWSKYSDEGMKRQDADELLMEAYEQF